MHENTGTVTGESVYFSVLQSELAMAVSGSKKEK
jgi:hypothetical protein